MKPLHILLNFWNFCFYHSFTHSFEALAVIEKSGEGIARFASMPVSILLHFLFVLHQYYVIERDYKNA